MSDYRMTVRFAIVLKVAEAYATEPFEKSFLAILVFRRSVRSSVHDPLAAVGYGNFGKDDALLRRTSAPSLAFPHLNSPQPG